MTVEEQPYTVVVGVSAASTSPAALLWARAQSEANGGRLIAARVNRVPDVSQGPSGSSSRMPQNPDVVRAEQHARLQRDVTDVLGEDHGAEIRVVQGSKRRGLLAQAHGASLLVIDAPRMASMSPLLAHRIVYAATCPVVEMPLSISGPPSPRCPAPHAPSGEQRCGRPARACGRATVRRPLRPTDPTAKAASSRRTDACVSRSSRTRRSPALG